MDNVIILSNSVSVRFLYSSCALLLYSSYTPQLSRFALWNGRPRFIVAALLKIKSPDHDIYVDVSESRISQ